MILSVQEADSHLLSFIPPSFLYRLQTSLTALFISERFEAQWGVLATIFPPDTRNTFQQSRGRRRLWQRIEAQGLVVGLFWLAAHVLHDPEDYSLKAYGAKCFFFLFSPQRPDTQTELDFFFFFLNYDY